MESIRDRRAILDSIQLYQVDQGVNKVRGTLVEIGIRHAEVEKEIRGKY